MNDFKTFAEELFHYSMLMDRLTNDLENHITKILDLYDLDQLPFEEITHDWYDFSFEILGAQPSIKPTEDHKKEFWRLGFKRFWIRYLDGREEYFYNDQGK